MRDPITTYESTGRDRLSLRAWIVMFGELMDYRELTYRLILRGIAGQFRQSVLGYVWIVLPPIATTVVFSVLQRARIFNVDLPSGTMPYALFALVGATVWSFFAQITSAATTSLSSAGPLVSKIYFPREILVFSSCGGGILNLLVRIIVVLLTCLLLGFMPHWQAIAGIFLFIPLTALALGLALFLAPLHTVVNDVGRVLEFVFQFGLFVAPTVYPTPELSTASGGWQVALYWLHVSNPVSHYLYAIQDLINFGTFSFTPGLQASLIFSLVIFLGGWRFFHACEPLLAERL